MDLVLEKKKKLLEWTEFSFPFPLSGVLIVNSNTFYMSLRFSELQIDLRLLM